MNVDRVSSAVCHVLRFDVDGVHNRDLLSTHLQEFQVLGIPGSTEKVFGILRSDKVSQVFSLC